MTYGSPNSALDGAPPHKRMARSARSSASMSRTPHLRVHPRLWGLHNAQHRRLRLRRFRTRIYSMMWWDSCHRTVPPGRLAYKFVSPSGPGMRLFLLKNWTGRGSWRTYSIWYGPQSAPSGSAYSSVRGARSARGGEGLTSRGAWACANCPAISSPTLPGSCAPGASVKLNWIMAPAGCSFEATLPSVRSRTVSRCPTLPSSIARTIALAAIALAAKPLDTDRLA